MIFLLSVSILVVVAIFGVVLGAASKSPWPKILYVIAGVFFVCGLVTYTPDWDGYSYWMSNDAGRDIVFQFLSALYRDNGYEYSALHMTYVLLHAIILVYLASKLTKNYFIVVFIYISIIYLFYTTQIRFFLAYFLFAFGAYCLVIDRRHWRSALFFVAAVLNHSALILMAPLVLLFYVSPKKLGRSILFLASGFWTIALLLNLTALLPAGAEYFSSYISSDAERPGLLGSFLVFGPYILSSALLYFFIRGKAGGYRSLEENPLLRYSWYMALTPMVYLPIAMGLQIVGHRFIVSSLIFHLCAWMSLFKVQLKFSKELRYGVLIGIWSIFLSFTYLIPSLFGMDSYLDSSLKVFGSNMFFR
ncbi:EpsG family protein [Variovorax sp. RCC_210]|uniref:EpsG family protein n=1 Tax=Variovorax sp. RCC_210 TaxID=3239217 RepID=UPI0035249FDC